MTLGYFHGPLSMDDFRLEQADDRFGKGVVAAVADAADRRLDAGIGQPFAVLDRQILNAIDRHQALHGPRRPAHRP